MPRTFPQPQQEESDGHNAPGAEESAYDLFVIGGGSGGVRGSRTAAGFGAKVGDHNGVVNFNVCEEFSFPRIYVVVEGCF
jgi:hypothetical protein